MCRIVSMLYLAKKDDDYRRISPHREGAKYVRKNKGHPVFEDFAGIPLIALLTEQERQCLFLSFCKKYDTQVDETQFMAEIIEYTNSLMRAGSSLSAIQDYCLTYGVFDLPDCKEFVHKYGEHPCEKFTPGVGQTVLQSRLKQCNISSGITAGWIASGFDGDRPGRAFSL